MKNKIIVTKEKNEIKFYLKNDNGEFWLFTKPFSYELYKWFKNGRSEREIAKFSKWECDPSLVNAIKRIPREVKYVTKYIIPDEIAA